MSNGTVVHYFDKPIDIGQGAFVTAASRRGDDITVSVVGGTHSGKLDLGAAFDLHRGFNSIKLAKVRQAVRSDHGYKPAPRLHMYMIN
jgi:hypothetical protein